MLKYPTAVGATLKMFPIFFEFLYKLDDLARDADTFSWGFSAFHTFSADMELQFYVKLGHFTVQQYRRPSKKHQIDVQTLYLLTKPYARVLNSNENAWAPAHVGKPCAAAGGP